eukprot:UN10043
MVNSLFLITEYGKVLEIVCSTFSIDSEGFYCTKHFYFATKIRSIHSTHR